MNQLQIEGSHKGGLSTKEYWNNIERKYNQNPILCLKCNKPLSFLKRKGKFCSHRCSAIFNNNRLGTSMKSFCKCGRILRSKKQRNLCHICWPIEYIQLWLIGKISGEAGGKLSIIIRNWLIKERGAKCERCGWSEVNTKSGNVPITIDHIDGNSRNHVVSNLRILCPNCHALTHTYCSLNLGNGRIERRLHYSKTIRCKNVTPVPQ